MTNSNKNSNFHIIFLCVGCIIGWGAFILPGELFLKIGLANSLLGMAIGMLLIIIIARSYSFVLSRIPQTGGEFIFTLSILGKTHGFICGWFLALAYLCIIPLNATALPIVIDYFGLGFLHAMPLYTIYDTNVYLGDIIISLSSIFIIALINIKGVKISFGLQKFLTIILCGSVLVSFSIMCGDNISWANLQTYPLNFSARATFSIIAISPWLFVGFECGVQIVKEIKYNAKIFWLFTIFAIIIGFLLYVALLFITTFGIPFNEIALAKWATGQSVYNYFGVAGSIMLALGIIGAVLSGINGFFISTSKVFLSMAKNNTLPHALLIKNQFGISYKIIICIAIISCIMPFFGRKALLFVVDMSSVGIVIAFLYVNFIALYIKYKEVGKVDILAIIGILSSLLFISLLFLPFSPSALKLPSIIALCVWCVLGGIVYYLAKVNKNFDYAK